MTAPVAASSLGFTAYLDPLIPAWNAQAPVFAGIDVSQGSVLSALVVIGLTVVHSVGVRSSGRFQSTLATAVVVLLSMAAALMMPLDRLAEITSTFVLIIWALANVALILLKLRGEPAPEGTFVVPLWVPFVGVATSTGLIAISVIG